MTGLFGTLVNTVAVLIGGTIGLILNSRFPERISASLMKSLGLCTLLIGITGILKGENQLVTIVSMAVGTLVGEFFDLDAKLNSVGDRLQKRLAKGRGGTSIAEGFVNASLLFCVGAMSIVGSLQAGLTGDNSMIFTKSLLDFTSSLIFASTFGIGVLFSAAFVFAYQGSIVVLAHYISPFLSDTAIAEMTCVGSLIIIGLALNMLGLTRLKVMNLVPAIFLPIVIYLFI